jgi:hypothetical protein
MPSTRPPYAPEFSRQMVELVRIGRTPEELAREFEPPAQAIRNWLAQAARDDGRRADGLTSAEGGSTGAMHPALAKPPLGFSASRWSGTRFPTCKSTRPNGKILVQHLRLDTLPRPTARSAPGTNLGRGTKLGGRSDRVQQDRARSWRICR